MKITTIGAGSIVWGPSINIDFLLNPGLDGAELMLMDIDAESLQLVQQVLQRLVEEKGVNKTIKATGDLVEAVRDADYVVTAISVGGDRLWRYDAMFPQIYDVFQPVGDTIGPGGLMRALRHIPPLMEIGQRMLQVSKPDAVMLQLTNPMNPICAALRSLDGLTVYGICHGVDDTEDIFARQLGVSKDQVHVEAAGNNHNIYCTEIRIGEELYTQDRLPELVPTLFDTPFRAEVFRRYNALVGNHSRHPIEFLPDFLNAESEFGRKWGVNPLPSEIDPLRGSRQYRERQVLEAALSQREPISWRLDRCYRGLVVNDEGLVEARHTREVIDEFIVALERKDDFFIHLNVPNEGAIAGVSPQYNVELPINFKNGTLTRKSVQFNRPITQEIERVGREQYLIAQGFLNQDKDLFGEALSMDALVPSRHIAHQLVQEMTEFERDYLPSWV